MPLGLPIQAVNAAVQCLGRGLNKQNKKFSASITMCIYVRPDSNTLDAVAAVQCLARGLKQITTLSAGSNIMLVDHHPDSNIMDAVATVQCLARGLKEQDLRCSVGIGPLIAGIQLDRHEFALLVQQ